MHLDIKNRFGRSAAVILDFKKLLSTAKKNSWLMFVNPQNPGGTVYTKKEIRKIFFKRVFIEYSANNFFYICI